MYSQGVSSNVREGEHPLGGVDKTLIYCKSGRGICHYYCFAQEGDDILPWDGLINESAGMRIITICVDR